ncbi:hypothetical protein Y032_0338g2929 [Ancylostoma ceylanicum]|nr:hypothetical protein Y032_0338g2929 [Ancylostoma ceylanicum]
MRKVISLGCFVRWFSLTSFRLTTERRRISFLKAEREFPQMSFVLKIVKLTLGAQFSSGTCNTPSLLDVIF